MSGEIPAKSSPEVMKEDPPPLNMHTIRSIETVAAVVYCKGNAQPTHEGGFSVTRSFKKATRSRNYGG